jgi:pimeloyl-ACP methyl ester carboxylesterase
MNTTERNSEIRSEQVLFGTIKRRVISKPAIGRRAFLAGGTAVGASVLLGRMAKAASLAGVDGPAFKESAIHTNGITLHVTEQGEGPAVLFCHGFPDTSYTWRQQMKAVASAGYRAIAPDMRGYGRSSAPANATLYTPLHTAGDLVGLLDALNIPSAAIVGHDWGAAHAWNAAMMRPDRFKAVFCLSVPYVPRGDVSVFERMRKTGHGNDFYMFEQIKPEADQIGPTPLSPSLGFSIGHRVLRQRISGGVLWILHEAFIVRLRGRCHHGRSRITSLITQLNLSVPAFTAP